eukprot:CAMPEP_0181415394 /NCGR_PEP_ID=MMETSP1110-20121109/9995_1 /TAXON_ID=174948 /ORGANISM="Symbiodinium sp., Strain CCMP421" /LENGTH=542 /DNA_ID=CAMNT_0023538297 /DNA_START=14 /DNA_END=1639 /DNA_ORIENTATION=-
MWRQGAPNAFLSVIPPPEGRRSAPPISADRAGDGQLLALPLPSPKAPSEGASGPGTFAREMSPRHPFLMPDMDPLLRQQGLIFQQSELLREQFMKFAEALQRLHAGVGELREDLLAEHHQRLHAEETMTSTLATFRKEVHEHIEERLALIRDEASMRTRSIEGEVQRFGSCLDAVSQQLGGQIFTVAEDQRMLSENLANKVAAIQESLGQSAASKAMVDELRREVDAKIQREHHAGTASLQKHEAMLKQEIAALRCDQLCGEELWAEKFGAVETASQNLCSEMAAEHQQTRISALGLATELSELREAMTKESVTYQESTQSVELWVTETIALKQALQEEELAHAGLSHSVAENKVELQKQAAQSKTLAEAAADYTTGKEELWQMLNTLQDGSQQTFKDVQELRLRTQHMEIQRFGQVSRQLDELGTQQGDAAAKLASVESAQTRQEKSWTQKLDTQAKDLLRAQSRLDQLAEQSLQHDFIESKDQQYRLYVTMDGDIGIFRRAGWGKHGGDFAGVPRWHAGAVGEKALCSVNRETQSYEKDR